MWYERGDRHFTPRQIEMTILSTAPLPVRPRLSRPKYDSWQEAMKDAVRDAGELCRLLGLPADLVDEMLAAGRQFPLFVPRGFLARMHPGDPHDPLLRQVLPIGEELADATGFSLDPVDDASAAREPGLLHKYAGRVLLVTTGACAIHCRYCFRRHYPYSQSPRSLADWQSALEVIADDATIHEVILSGGDPLTIVDDTLSELVEHLERIPHLRRLRIHTRLPIVIPERVTSALVAMLQHSRLTPIIVIHANHARELDEQVAEALAKLSTAGVVLLNQAVLLAGVNDSTEAQADLCERLVNLRVLPYYLHQLDRVTGAAHFEVPIETGRRIIDELRSRLPGYAVPRFVREVAGELSKTVLE
jgi:L-lysine 2,3-aminomutase